MTDIQAAVGREQLKRLPAILQQRRRLASRYAELLADIPGLGLPHDPTWARSNWQSFALQLPEQLDRREVMQSMLDRGVSTRRGIMCSHLEHAYGDASRYMRLPMSERAQQRTVLLPLFPGMTVDEQATVVGGLRQACPVVASHTMVAPARPAPNSRIVGAARATDMA